jgi:hypothetical protein
LNAHGRSAKALQGDFVIPQVELALSYPQLRLGHVSRGGKLLKQSLESFDSQGIVAGSESALRLVKDVAVLRRRGRRRRRGRDEHE